MTRNANVQDTLLGHPARRLDFNVPTKHRDWGASHTSSQPTLVVDDEKNMRITLAAILRRVGYAVTLAENGEEAVELCVHRSFDLVVMDVRMPGIDGVEAVRRIRRRQTETKVILMSAYSLSATDQSTLGDGVVPFFSKPLDIPGLLSQVEALTQSLVVHIQDMQHNGNGSRGWRVGYDNVNTDKP